jgi:fatty-acyl-CoA synthase
MSCTPQTLYQVLAAREKTRGSAEALITASASLSYAEQHQQVRRAAKALHALGVRRGDFVGILMGNDETWVTLFYAAATLGAVTVPVNTRFKSSELAFCLAQADVKVLFTADRFLGIDFLAYLREAEPAIDHALSGAKLPLLRQVVVVGSEIPPAAIGFNAFLAGGSGVPDSVLDGLAAEVRPDDLLLIQFTSGTTAYPKAVMLTHDNMLRDAWAVGTRMGIRPDDRYFNCRPFFHVAGTTLSLLVSLIAGACLVTLPTFEAGAALAMMASERCTLTSGNDTLFQLMLGHPSFDPTLLCLRGGWAAAGPETIRNIVEQMGARDICVAYGLSEASPNVVLNDYRDPLELRIAGLARPHDGVEVRITARETGALLPAEEAGEIEVRGWNVMRGYYKNPEETAKAFTADGWLRTGDIGVLTADGRLRMVGRSKDVFRVGGENVAPAEVEEVLLAHPAVATAQVVGVPDARLGEVGAAFVTLKASTAAS